MPLLNMPTNQAKIIKYPCPACGNTHTEQINQPNPHNISLDICSYCGFIYRKNFLDKKSYQDFTRHFHKSMITGQNCNLLFQKDRIRYSLYKTYLSEYEDKKSVRHLDIGTSIGDALKLFNTNSIGIELSEDHYKYAKHDTGLDIRNTLDINDGSFDLITCRILALIPDLGNFLDTVHNKLNENGTFFIICPTLDWPSFEFFRGGISLEYAHIFTQASLKGILEQHGFEITLEEQHSIEYLLKCKKVTNRENITKCLENGKKLIRHLQALEAFAKKDTDAIKKINPEIGEGWIIKIDHETIEHMDDSKVQAQIEEMAQFFDYRLNALGTAGHFYATRHMYDKAIECFKRAEKKVWGQDIFSELALCFYDTGIYDLAAKYLDKASFMMGDHSPQILEKKAAAYRKIKEI